MRKFAAVALMTACWVGSAFTRPLDAFVAPGGSPLEAKAYRHPQLHIPSLELPLTEVGGRRGTRALERELVSLGADPVSGGRYDWRAGRWGSLVLSRPLIPGDGKGNKLAGARPPSEGAVWKALTGFLTEHQPELRLDLAELGPPRVSVLEKGNFVLVHSPRVVKGVPVRDSGLSATINHGNLLLLGFQNWGTVEVSLVPKVTAAEAQAVVVRHVQPFAVSAFRDDARLELIPLARGETVAAVAVGAGYDYRLAWVLSPTIEDDLGGWEALVDAATGELLSFQDTNSYAVRRTMGGVYPVSNDQRPPDGLEQEAWPMPYTNIVGGPFTTTGGVVPACIVSPMETTLNGQFIRINDNCGAISETSAGDLDLGFGPTATATDCEVPAGHSPGDTKASRTAFYELNRMKEQARGYLPSNNWLQQVLQANVNIDFGGLCNAFWSEAQGTVTFYRSGTNCGNTGEIGAVLDHEFGHGMADNDADGTQSSPSEGGADIFGTLRLNNSCVGRGFETNQVCDGFGDQCDGTPATGCTGIRDNDWIRHRCDRPHTVTWITQGFTTAQCTGGAPACPSGGGFVGPCNRSSHCEGMVVGETIWDLHARDLVAAPFNLDSNTALELATRLNYLGSGLITGWYLCAVGGSCGATRGYMQFLAADDDNGNLNDGTPHMSAIRAAFERHEIHCTTPTVVNSGCAGGPTTAPVVTATPTAGGVDLSWGAVAGAANYAVYRTEGVFGCDFGKVKIGTTANTTFSDTGLRDGRTYYYNVLPIGSNTSCFGRMSACASAVPLTPAEPCAVITLSFVSASSSVGEAAGPAAVDVVLTTSDGQATTNVVSADFVSADGTATAGSDYTATSGTLTFPSGTPSGTTQTLMVPILDDPADEPDETFTLTLSNPVGGTLGAITVHTVTIVDNNVPVELQTFVVE
jgi:hypothetical protein